MTNSTLPTNIEQYMDSFPAHTQRVIEQIRATIRQAAPDAEESFSYQMPSYKLHGVLVYFAVYKNHIGFYPGAEAIEHFKTEMKGLKISKGTVQFHIDKPIPYALISKITAWRVIQNVAKMEGKRKCPPFVPAPEKRR